MLSKNLHKAKSNINDEFYTLLSDIEKELWNYKDKLKGKSILCNCDNPEFSMFWKFFHDNFKELGIKKLTSTYYDYLSPVYITEYDGEKVTKTRLRSLGDFRCRDVLNLLKESDVVVSNPPFSLFRAYFKQLMTHNKDFIVVGNYISVSYEDVFEQIKLGKVDLGYSPRGMDFTTPSGKTENVNASWFSTLSLDRPKDKIPLTKIYSEEAYKKYDNHPAINIDKVTDIPKDYQGLMGVPVTFLEKYNSHQFELVDCMGGLMLNGKSIFTRIIIKHK